MIHHIPTHSATIGDGQAYLMSTSISSHSVKCLLILYIESMFGSPLPEILSISGAHRSSPLCLTILFELSLSPHTSVLYRKEGSNLMFTEAMAIDQIVTVQ